MPQRIGVQAVVDTSQLQAGVNTYLSAINRMVSATQAASRGLSLGFPSAGLSAATQGFSSISNGFITATQHATTFSNQITNVANNMTQAGGAATALQAGIGAALGTAAIQGIQALGDALKALSADIVEQVGFWERLAISVQFFTAIDLQRENKEIPFADALKQTQQEAEGTLLWLQKLSVLSPFTAQQVGQIYRVGQAMGLTKDQADATIQPLLDIGSAAGLSADVLERVAIAMGQVESRGKLTGEEIRQFANAGIPIKRILMDALDKTAGEFDEMLEKGQFLSGDVLPNIIKYMQQFEGAAEEVSKTTITGLLSSLSEVGQLGVAKFFGKATEQVREQLRQLVEFITSPEIFAGLEVIGTEVGQAVSAALTSITQAVNGMVQAWIALDPVVKQAIFVFAGGVVVLTAFAGAVGLLTAAVGLLVSPFTVVVAAVAGFVAAWSTDWGGIASTVSSAVDAAAGAIDILSGTISDLVSFLGDAASSALDIFAETLSAAAEWGANIVSSFADGILATVSVVADALAAIGEMMAFWLQPGSPPRLLPDLDKWGTEAANVWLSAWTEADFGALDKIGNNMKKILQGEVFKGNLEEIDVPRMVLGAQGSIADAIQQIRTLGSTTEDVMKRVRQSTGQAAEQVVGYLNRFTETVRTTKIVEEAQTALNKVTAKYEELLAPLQNRLTAIADAQKKMSDDKEIRRLERVIKSRYATEAARKMAILKLDEITTQRQLDSTEAQRDAATDIAQKRLDAASKAKDLAQQELDLFQKRIDAQLSEIDLLKQIEQIENKRDRSASERLKKAKKELTPLEKQLKLLKLQQEELADMIEAFRARRTLEDEHATAAQKAAAQMKLQEVSLNQQKRDVEALELGYSGVFDEIRKIQIVLADIEKPKKGKDKGTISGLASDLGGPAKEKIKQAFDEYQEGIRKFTERWTEAKKSFGETINTIDASLPSWLRLQDAAGGMPPILSTLAQAFAGVAAVLVGNKLISSFKALIPIFKVLGGTGTLLITAITLLAAAWTQNWFDIQGVTARAINDITKRLDELAKGDSIFGVIIRGFQQFGDDLRVLWSNLAITALDPNIFWENFDVMVVHLQEFFNEVLAHINAAIPKIKEAFLKMFPDLSGVFDEFEKLFDFDTGDLQRTLGQVGNLLGNLGPKFSAAVILVTSSVKGLKLAFANIGPIMSTFGGLFKTAFAAILSGSWQAAMRSAVVAAKALGLAMAGAFKVLATPTTGRILVGLSKSLVGGIGALGGILRSALIKTIADAFSGIGGSVLTPKGFIGLIISDRFQQGLIKGFRTMFDFLPTLLGDTFRAFNRNLSGFILRIDSWRDLVVAAFKGPLEAMKLFATAGRSVLGFFSTFLVNLGGAAITKFSTPLVKAFGLVEQAIIRVTPAASKVFGVLLKLGDSLAKAGAFALRFATDFRGAMAGLKVGNIFGTITKGAGEAAKILGSLGTVLKNSFSLKGLLSPIQGIIKLFGGLGAVIAKGVGGGGGAISGILSTFAKGFGGLKTIITGIGPAIKGLLAPTNIIGFTIGFIVDQIVKNWAAISGFFGDLGGFLTELGGLFNPALLGNFMTALEGLFSGTEEGKKKFQAFFESVFGYLVNWTGRIGNWFMTKVLPAFVGWAINLPREIGGYIVETFNAIVDIILKGAELIRVYVLPLLGAFTSWVIEAWPTISGYLGQLWNDFAGWINETAALLWTNLTTLWIPAFVGWLTEVWPGFYAGLSSLVVNLTGWIISTAGSLLNLFVTQWLPAFVGWIIDVWPSFFAGLVSLLSMLAGWITSTASWLATKFITEWGPAMWNWIATTIPPLLGQLAAWAGQLLVWLATQGLPLLIVALLDFATAMVDWVGQAAVFILPKLGEFIGTVLSWIVTDGIPMLVGAVVGLAAALYGWISGSSEINAGDSAWGKVGAAFQKFIGKIGEVITNDVLPALVKGAEEMVTTFIDGVMKIFSPENLDAFREAAIDMGSDIIGGIGQGIRDGIDSLNNAFNDTVGGAIDDTKAWLGIHSPSTRTADEIGAPLAEGINEGISGVPLDALAAAIAEQLVKALTDVKQNTTQTMTDTAAATLPVAQQFALDMQNLFLTMTTTITNQLWLWSQGVQLLYLELGTNVETTLNTTAVNQMVIWTLIHQTATSWAVALKDAVVTAFTEMAAAIDKITSEVPGQVWTHLGDKAPGLLYMLREDFVPEGEKIGSDFAEGIYKGIKDEIPGIVRIVTDMIDRALSAAKNAMNAHSPSRETRDEVGIPFSQGIAVGIEEGSKDVLDQVSDLINQTLDTNAYESGLTIGQRVIAGLRDSASGIAETANSLIGEVLSSRAFSVGQTIGQQIAAGITASASTISTAVGGAVNSAMVSPVQLASANLTAAPAMSGVGTVNNYIYNRNYNLTLNTSEDSGGIARDFKMMEIMAL